MSTKFDKVLSLEVIKYMSGVLDRPYLEERVR